jgi:DNA-binding CsgD family transcriptional regulator
VGQWNKFISYVTGGLLYGHEVPRPEWLGEVRKRAYRPQVNRGAPRREEVMRRVLAGESIEEIGWGMGITPQAVRYQLHVICKQEGVAGRRELARKLGGAAEQPTTFRQKTAERREKVLGMLMAGLSPKEIVARLGAKTSLISGDIQQIYRKHGIKSRHSRAELAERLGMPMGASSYSRIRKQITEMREAGMRAREIAERLGVGEHRVWYHLRCEQRRSGRVACLTEEEGRAQGAQGEAVENQGASPVPHSGQMPGVARRS